MSTFQIVGAIAGLVGGTAGLLTAVWRLIEIRRAYLHIAVEAHAEQKQIRIHTEVENKAVTGKKLHAAFLIIGPQHEEPNETVKVLKPEFPPFDNLNEMVRLTATLAREESTAITDGRGRSLVPLPYYHRENYDVGDETLSYDYLLDFKNTPSGFYEVRFYLDPPDGLYRVVQAAFAVTEARG
jgi:hypothetical protein